MSSLRTLSDAQLKFYLANVAKRNELNAVAKSSGR